MTAHGAGIPLNPLLAPHLSPTARAWRTRFTFLAGLTEVSIRAALLTYSVWPLYSIGIQSTASLELATASTAGLGVGAAKESGRRARRASLSVIEGTIFLEKCLLCLKLIGCK